MIYIFILQLDMLRKIPLPFFFANQGNFFSKRPKIYLLRRTWAEIPFVSLLMLWRRCGQLGTAYLLFCDGSPIFQGGICSVLSKGANMVAHEVARSVSIREFSHKLSLTRAHAHTWNHNAPALKTCVVVGFWWSWSWWTLGLKWAIYGSWRGLNLAIRRRDDSLCWAWSFSFF